MSKEIGKYNESGLSAEDVTWPIIPQEERLQPYFQPQQQPTRCPVHLELQREQQQQQSGCL